MNKELVMNVVNYAANHLGNLPDDSITGFENYTNNEIDVAVKYLEEVGVFNIAQSEAYSYCGVGDVKSHNDSTKYYTARAFISKEKLDKLKILLED